MSYFFPNVDPAFVYQRKGTTDDPYIFRHESATVSNSIVTLMEIPHYPDRVIIKKLDNTTLTEVTTDTLQVDEYRVDYSTGVIYFDSSLEGIKLTCDYWGTAYISFPASRVWVDSNTDSQNKSIQQLVSDLDNSKTNWLAAVNAYSDIATTYPTPKLGDTVQTTSDGRIFRFDGNNWINTQLYSANALSNISNEIGVLTDLQTTDKSTIVNAINEQKGKIDTNSNNVGVLANLQTTDKSSIVDAINDNVASLAQIAHQVSANGTDDTDAIQSAINACHNAGGGTVLINGIAVLKAKYQKPFAGGTINYALQMYSNVRVQGANIASGFKLADNESTDTSPKNLVLFYSNEYLQNVEFIKCTFDLNEANNKISPQRGSGVYNRFLMSAVMFSTDNARCDNLLIEDCHFKNQSGTTVIGLGQSNTAGTALGQNNIINRCTFDNCGTDTDDHSSLFGWAEDMRVTNCIFELPTIVPDIPRVACEIHGKNSVFAHNTVRNYWQGLWVATNLTNDTENVKIHDNTFTSLRGVAIDFYHEGATETKLRKIKIHHNHIDLTDDSVSIDLKAGVQIASNYSISDVDIYDNTFEKVGTNKASAAVNLTCKLAGQTHTDIKINGNKTNGVTLGVNITSAQPGNIGTVEVKDNVFKNLKTAGGSAPQGVAAYGDSARPIGRLAMKQNTFDTSDSFGIRLEGSFSRVESKDNSYISVPTPYAEAAVTITTKYVETPVEV